jgi:hypothetical protein
MLRRRTRPIFRRQHRRQLAPRHLALALLLALALPARAEAPAPARRDDTMLLSLVLRPGAAASADGIGAVLLRDGVLEALPPGGLHIESWYAMPGLGQLVTLRLPAEVLRGAGHKGMEMALR